MRLSVGVKAAMAILSVGAIGTGLSFVLRAPKPKSCEEAPSPRVYEVFDRESWRGLSANAPNQVLTPENRVLAGWLHLASSKTGDGRSVTARFVTSEKSEQKLEASAEVRLRTNCGIESVVFDGRQPLPGRRALQRYLFLVDLAAGVEPVSEHEDEFGVYKFTRDRGNDEVTYSRGELVRRSEAPPDARRAIEAVHSSRIMVRASDETFANHIEAQEHFIVEVGTSRDRAEHDYLVRLTATTLAPDLAAAAAPPPTYSVAKRPGEAFASVTQPSLYESGSVDKAEADIEHALENFLETVAESPRESKLALLTYLRKQPGAWDELRRQIADEAFDDAELVHLLHIAARGGDAAGQSLLTSLLGDEAVGLSTRIRVLFAANGIAVPSPELVAVVREIAGRFPTSEGEDEAFASTAVYTSGILARTSWDVAPPLAEELRADLRRGLDETTDPNRRAVYISGAANTHFAAEFAEDLKRFVASTHDVERQAAFEGLGYMAVDGREALLASAAAVEPMAANRAVIAQVFGRVGFADGANATEYARAVARETHAPTRALGVSALAKASGTIPAAKAAVLAQVKATPDPEVLVAAGRYLGATELAQSLPGRRP